jgi:WS/DGAT/MGAT family acyltransferase
MIITSLMTFDTPLDVERLKEILQVSLISRFSRFRQRLVWPELQFRRPVWEADPDFNLDDHIERVTLKPPADQAALQDFISDLMGQPLDPRHPLWRYYVVENYGTGSALVVRLHHCLADGIALIHVLLSMTDTSPDAPRPVLPVEEPDEPRPASGLWEETLSILPAPLQSGARVFESLAQTGLKALENPAYAYGLARLGTRTAVAAGRLALRWPDPETIFKGPLGAEKRAVWSAPLRLADVKFIGRAFGATVNDVLLTAFTGALRCYLLSHREPVEGLSIRGIVPFNLRPQGPVRELGNKFGLVFLTLPVGVEDPIQRLRALKCCMDGIKDSPEALATYGILGTLGSLHPLLQEVAVSIFDAKGTAVMTNVAGPRQQLYLAGSPINTLMAWVPEAGRVSLGVSIISYNGKVWLGVATDKHLVPDPESFIADFNSEFGEMKHRAELRMAERRAPFKPMLSMLDEALKSLDEVLESARPQAARDLMSPSLTPALASCQGRTRRGLPCKNPPLQGQAFCRVHRKTLAAK